MSEHPPCNTEWVVPCPTCDAGVGHPCVDRGALGTPMAGSSGWHLTRWTALCEDPVLAADIDRIHGLTRARVAREREGTVVPSRPRWAGTGPSSPGPSPATGHRKLGHAREQVAARLAAVAAELNAIAQLGRVEGVLPIVDAVHLEALSDHLALCSNAALDSRGPLELLSKRLW
jgi:hypothetical protein